MTIRVDQNRVIFTGENPFIRLGQEEVGELTTRTSLWRCVYSPAGPGHTLFMVSELTDGKARIYSDNMALARWLQENLQGYMYAPFGDRYIPLIEAVFGRSGDVRSFWTESVRSETDDVMLTWYDFLAPFLINTVPGSRSPNPNGLYTLLFPATAERLVLNGEQAAGRPLAESRDGKSMSTSCLAFAETWLAKP